jgi:nitroreductase
MERTGKTMANVKDAIKARRSVRAYQEKPLAKGMVLDILEAARYAPTARNAQELEYKVISNRALMQRISDGITAAIKREMGDTSPPPNIRPSYFYNAPLLIIVTAPKDNSWGHSDASLAVQNIMLYATSVGLGTCFIGMIRFVEKEPELLAELHIADGRGIVAAVICGHPAEQPEEKEKVINAEFFE